MRRRKLVNRRMRRFLAGQGRKHPASAYHIPTFGFVAYAAVYRADEILNLDRAGVARRARDHDLAKLLLILSKRVRLARKHGVLP